MSHWDDVLDIVVQVMCMVVDIRKEISLSRVPVRVRR